MVIFLRDIKKSVLTAFVFYCEAKHSNRIQRVQSCLLLLVCCYFTDEILKNKIKLLKLPYLNLKLNISQY